MIDWQERHKYPLTFITEASLDLADDEDLLELMDLANIRSVFVGIETPNEDALKETRKTQNLRGHNRSIPEKVAAIQAHGIEVWSGMMLGFDTDSADIFERQIKLVEDAKDHPLVGRHGDGDPEDAAARAHAEVGPAGSRRPPLNGVPTSSRRA